MEQLDFLSTRPFRTKSANLIGKVVRIDENALKSSVKQGVQPVSEQRFSSHLNQAFRRRIRNRTEACA